MSLHLVTGYEGAEHIQSQDQGSFNIAAFGGGQYVLDHGYKFAASLLAGNTVSIKDGDMLIQGRHVRLAAGQTEDVTYDYGTTGMLRKDLICARYTKNNSTGVEDIQFVVIKGTEASSAPVDPEYNQGTITDGNDLINDFPMYRLTFNGTEVTLSDPLFEVHVQVNEAIEGLTQDISDIMDGTKTVASATEAGHATTADSATTATSASSASYASTAGSATTAGSAMTAGSATTAGSANNDFILKNNQPLSFTNKVCEISDARITADSLADVYFTQACMQAALKASVSVETTAGKLTLTAERTPESTLTASIRIRVV